MAHHKLNELLGDQLNILRLLRSLSSNVILSNQRQDKQTNQENILIIILYEIVETCMFYAQAVTRQWHK